MYRAESGFCRYERPPVHVVLNRGGEKQISKDDVEENREGSHGHHQEDRHD